MDSAMIAIESTRHTGSSSPPTAASGSSLGRSLSRLRHSSSYEGGDAGDALRRSHSHSGLASSGERRAGANSVMKKARSRSRSRAMHGSGDGTRMLKGSSDDTLRLKGSGEASLRLSSERSTPRSRRSTHTSPRHTHRSLRNSGTKHESDTYVYCRLGDVCE